MWRYGGGDWTLPWRLWHGLGEDFRPVNDPTAEPQPILNVARYRRMIYGYAKAAAVLEEGHPAKKRRPIRQRDVIGPNAPSGEQTTPGGVVLPTGTHVAPS